MSSSGARQDIPPIAGWPLIGNAIELRWRRLALLDRVWSECGPIARIRLGPTDIVLVTDADLAHDVLVTNSASYVKSRTLGQFARPLLGAGLLTSEHELHARQRRRMASVFPHAKVLEWVSKMATRGEEAGATWADGQVIDAAEEMMLLTLRIVTETLFGSDVSQEAKDIREAITDANRYVASQATRIVHPPSWFPMPGAIRNRRAIRPMK